MSNQPLMLAIDGSTTAGACITLMISLIYKGRALPLVWLTRKGQKGHFPKTMHVELIKAVKKIIPFEARVIVLGDGEFDGTKWLNTIEDFGWNYACRTATNAILFEKGEPFRFQDICPEIGVLTEIEAVEFTDKRDMVVRAVANWGKAYQKPIYLITNALTGG